MIPCVRSFRIHLPASLRSTEVTPLLRYYGRSNSYRAVSSSRTLRRSVRSRGLDVGPQARALRAESPTALDARLSTPLPDRSPSLARLIFRPFRPQPPSCLFPATALARYFSRTGCRVYPPGRPSGSRDLSVARSGVHHLLAGSPTGLAESGSSSYGLVFHLLLLPTSPHGDAVTFGYRFVT